MIPRSLIRGIFDIEIFDIEIFDRDAYVTF